jgi:hypothetical protein
VRHSRWISRAIGRIPAAAHELVQHSRLKFALPLILCLRGIHVTRHLSQRSYRSKLFTLDDFPHLFSSCHVNLNEVSISSSLNIIIVLIQHPLTYC